MHKEFSEWYRVAGIEPDAEALPKRWTAIAEYNPTAEDVVSLTRLFYRLGKPKEEFLAEFVAAFQKTDPVFKTRDNDHELSVLAGAQLVDEIERQPDLSDLAALSIVCAAASNMRRAPCVRDIPEIAARYLGKRSSNRTSVIEECADTDPRKPLYDALKALGGPHVELVKELRRLQCQLSVVNEESDILWWLLGEHSRDTDKHWSKFSVTAVAVMAGKELADLTQIIPGPVASIAFLDRVIRVASPNSPSLLTIKDSINDVPGEWRQTYSDSYCPAELEDLMPLSQGIRLSLASSKKNAWVAPFKQKTGISADTKLAPRILAHQVFLEALLCRSWNESK